MDQCPLLNKEESTVKRIAEKGQDFCTLDKEDEQSVHVTYIDVVSKYGEIG